MNQIVKFKQLINDKEYYAAHEVLEELWFPIRKTKDDYCLVLKGFINAAVSLELNKRDKIMQSKKVCQSYLKYVTIDKMKNTEQYAEFNKLKLFLDIKFKEISFYQ
jgi:hypothetical protein